MVAAHVLKSTRGSAHNIQTALVRIHLCGMISYERLQAVDNFGASTGAKQWKSMICSLPNRIFRDMLK
jgi:hypothetical protein